MKKETAKIFGFANKEKLDPKSTVHLCKLIARMSDKEAGNELLYEILVSALTEDNGKLIELMEHWLKKEAKDSRLATEEDIKQLILWNRTASITIDDLKPKNDLIKCNLMTFKKNLGEKIRQNYKEGIPGLIKDMKLNKTAFYRFLSEERMPNEDMLKLIRDIFRRLGISKIEFVKNNPLSLMND